MVIVCCGVSNDDGFILWYAGGVGMSTVLQAFLESLVTRNVGHSSARKA